MICCAWFNIHRSLFRRRLISGTPGNSSSALTSEWQFSSLPWEISWRIGGRLGIGFLAGCTSGKAMASETWLFGLATIDNYQYGLKTISVWEDNPIGVYNFPRRIVSFAGKETGRQEFASSSTGSFSCDEPQDFGNHDSSKDGHHESMHLSRQQWRRRCWKIPLA